MPIWFKSYTLDDLNRRSENTLADLLGIRFTQIDDDSLTAIMPVVPSLKQPLGIVHGGANVVLAETVASTAANMVIDIDTSYCVGLEINANHIRAVREGILTTVARPIHIGRTTQVWHIDIYNELGKQTCVSRMTASVLTR
jgi:1,4-dihydroxy-2-naphthoyl-CoA hydrolase